jgi:hypothetical protein
MNVVARLLPSYFSLDIPWIGADGTDPDRKRFAEVAGQQAGGLGAPRVLTCPVRDVDQRDVGRAPVLVGRMVAQISRQVHLHPGLRYDVEQ